MLKYSILIALILIFNNMVFAKNTHKVRKAIHTAKSSYKSEKKKSLLNRYKIVFGKTGLISLKDNKSGKIKRFKLDLSKGIFMPKAKGKQSKTSKGYLRDSKLFWKEYKKKYNKELSMKNLLRIKEGKAPVVDKQWIKFHKDHRPFKGQKLEHHHLDHKGYAIPLPQALHRAKGNSAFFHRESKKFFENIKKIKNSNKFNNKMKSLISHKQMKEIQQNLQNSDKIKPILGKTFLIIKEIENKLNKK